ncbi:hypothetical protein AV656_13770 [Bhargavaea cecembensis]|uniref:Uncharacterized protein n=1 Tax=Bhargavaea cecembensis TaxID=394098 RepID=A0A163EP31_9BACL|nr:hypothetical protein AV656_13770 [Bhargavaea cecembensis]
MSTSEVQMAMEPAARIEGNDAGRASRVSIQVFCHRQLMTAGAAEDGFLGKSVLRPDCMPAATGFRVAGMAGKPFFAAEKLDCNPVGFSMVMEAPGLFIDDRAMYFVSMNNQC